MIIVITLPHVLLYTQLLTDSDSSDFSSDGETEGWLGANMIFYFFL